MTWLASQSLTQKSSVSLISNSWNSSPSSAYYSLSGQEAKYVKIIWKGCVRIFTQLGECSQDFYTSVWVFTGFSHNCENVHRIHKTVEGRNERSADGRGMIFIQRYWKYTLRILDTNSSFSTRQSVAQQEQSQFLWSPWHVRLVLPNLGSGISAKCKKITIYY